MVHLLHPLLLLLLILLDQTTLLEVKVDSLLLVGMVEVVDVVLHIVSYVEKKSTMLISAPISPPMQVTFIPLMLILQRHFTRNVMLPIQIQIGMLTREHLLT